MSIKNLFTDNLKSYQNLNVNSLRAAGPLTANRLRLEAKSYQIDDFPNQDIIQINESAAWLRIFQVPQINVNGSVSVTVTSGNIAITDLVFLTNYTLDNDNARKVSVSVDDISTGSFKITWRNNSNQASTTNSYAVYFMRIATVS